MKRSWGALDFAVAAFAMSIITLVGTVLTLVIFGLIVTSNTKVHDNLRGDEEGTRTALLEIAKQIRLRREQESELYGLKPKS